MIDRNTINTILNAADIKDVIGDFLTLKKRGANYWACCPFHGEKTPSFSVSPAKGIYKCFGCGVAGNVVSFVMAHESMTYVEALKYLARKYNIEVRERELTPEEQAVNNNRESMMVLSSFAQDYFSEQLWQSPSGQAIGLSYFRERGFSDPVIRKFQLGYSSDLRTAFSDAALKAGYKKEFLIATGLSIEKETALFDRFSGRVMFPIHSLSGRVIAFGARTLRQDKNVAKYLNSPESEIYRKTSVLYGIFQAKNAIVRSQQCYLVEGYTDVISMYQAGVENVVASSGTSLTIEQIRLIKRFTPNVTVLYDGDAAGIKASLRGIDMLLEEGMNVKVALFPDNEDPDSFAHKHSSSELEAFLKENVQDFISFKTKLLNDDAQNDPLKRAELIKDVVRSIGAIPDAIMRTVYVKECSRLLDIGEDVLMREVAKLRREKLYEGSNHLPVPDDKSTTETIPRPVPLPGFIEPEHYFASSEEEIIYYLLKYGMNPLFTRVNEASSTTGEEDSTRVISVAEYIMSELQDDDLKFTNLHYRQLFEEYDRLTDNDNNERIKYFIHHPDSRLSTLTIHIMDKLPALTVEDYIKSIVPESLQLQHIIPKAILVYKSRIIEVAAKSLTQQLQDAQTANNDAQIQELFERMSQLNEARTRISKALNRLIF
ncbi:MAG: DNA primase [Prevotellaceae bacterium]|jgi:DNA primase|nr:DNA primase [Prevotellaceae bacterium]